MEREMSLRSRVVGALAGLAVSTVLAAGCGSRWRLWFVTKDNIPSTTENYPYVSDFQAQYEKLWKPQLSG
jgi:hypothetical protein